MAALNDADIVSALKKDAESGFRLLMAKYKEAVYWHIRRLVVSHDDAQDAVQETFVRIFRSFRQFKGDCPFCVWIYRIATNEALRILERRKDERLSLDDPEARTSSLMADEYVDYSDLEAAFNLRYYDELGYDEIAAITNSTAANVKSNYHIAKEKIIKYMNSTD